MRIFRFAFVLIFTIVLATPVASNSMTNPSIVESITAEVLQEGNITVGKSALTARLDIYIPQETEFQKREILEVQADSYETIKDSYGNEFLRLYWINPDPVINFHIKTRVEVIRSSKTKVSDEEVFYQYPTELVNSNDSEIINLAEEITFGKKSEFEKASELVKWVHENIEYDKNYKNVNLSSRETLRIRKGVCSELTNLFQALARSIGLETRTSLGWVVSQYETEYEFQPHSWSEVKIGEYYIPFDSTWAEGGIVDATHIKFASFPDTLYVEATAVTTSSRNLDKPIINLETKIKLLNFTESPIVYSETFALDDEVWKGSVVTRTEFNTDECVLFKVRSISCGDESGQFLDTRKESEVIYLCDKRNYFSIFDIPPDIAPDKIYTCPVMIVSSFGEDNKVDIKLKREFAHKENVSLAISSDTALPNERITAESPGSIIFTDYGEFGLNILVIDAPSNDFTVYAYKDGSITSKNISLVRKKPFKIHVEANDTMIFGKNYTINITINNFLEKKQSIEIRTGNVYKLIDVGPSSNLTTQVEIVAEQDLIQVFANNGEFSTSSYKSVNLVVRRTFVERILGFLNEFLDKIYSFLGK